MGTWFLWFKVGSGGEALLSKWRTLPFLANKFAEEKHRTSYVGFRKDFVDFKETSAVCGSFYTTRFKVSLLSHEHEQS
jgi:hypothetical protein